MTITASDLRQLAEDRQARYSGRDATMRTVRNALRGKFDVSFRDLVPMGQDPAVANIPLAAARTMAQRVGRMPRLYGVSKFDSDTAKTRAEKHEDAVSKRYDAMRLSSLLEQASFWLITHGYCPHTLIWDPVLQGPRIRIRDPLTAYPDTVWPHEPGVRDCLFVFDMNPADVRTTFPETKAYFAANDKIDTVRVVEYHSSGPTIIAMVTPDPVLLAEVPNPVGKCNVWVPRDMTPDMDFHGQFDQVIPILHARAKLQALMMAYAEQQVAAETNVIGRIDSNDGNYAYGFGAVNVISPEPGASVSKVTNNMSQDVFRELSSFERDMRIAGGFPASMSGEPQASVATGRGIDRLEASVDDNIGHYQNILALTYEDISDRIPEFERAWGKIDPAFSVDCSVKVNFISGMDPGTNVQIIQQVGAKIIAKRTAMDQNPFITNPDAEEARIEVEAMREALLANLLARGQQGEDLTPLLTQIIKDRQKGTPIEDSLASVQAAQPAPQAPSSPSPQGGSAPSLQALLSLGAGGQPGGGTREQVNVA